MKNLPPIFFAFLVLFFMLASARTLDPGSARLFTMLALFAGAAVVGMLVGRRRPSLPRQSDETALLLERVQELEQRLQLNEDELTAAKAKLERVSEETEFYKELHTGPKSG